MKLSSEQKMKRLRMMVFGVLVIFFTGYPHIWSIYQPYVMDQTGWTQGQTSLCFYLALGFFVVGNIAGGKLTAVMSARKIIFLGGGLFTAGILLSSVLLISSPIPMYVTYGILQGVGQGMVYSMILAAAQKWFPEKTGFASGIVVTANGLCGFILAPISRMLLEKIGVSGTLLLIGCAVAVSWILCSIFMEVPDYKMKIKEAGTMIENTPQEREVQKQYTSPEMLKSPLFII